MQEINQIEADIRNLMVSQRFAVLSTLEPHHPYVNLVAFAETGDLRTILFATQRATRKYQNIASHAGVSFLIDNRSNEATDIRQAIALTVLGFASEVPVPERQGLADVYLQKQPQMKDFLGLSDTSLIRVEVASYILVSRFQDVAMLVMP